jgi:peroxiredoxin
LTVRDAAPGKKDTRGIEINHGFAERTTFIVTPDGKIAATLTGLTPAVNVAKSLEVVQHIADAKNSDKW